MKLIGAEYGWGTDAITVGVVGDNALLRNNDDFYIPDFSREVSGVPQLMFRVCKLGKGVSELFARRYYDEVGVCLRFYADTLEADLRQRGLPTGVAAAFDGSVAVSAMVPYAGEDVSYALYVNGNAAFAGRMHGLPVSVDRFVAVASSFCTIKVGDFLCCGSPYRHPRFKIGDVIRMEMDGKEMMEFRVR